MGEKINRFYPAWLELIPLLLLGFVVYYTAAHYSQLPARMPTHFGFSGQPDAWSTKGFAEVYMPVMIGIVVWLSMALLNYFLIIKPDDPGRYINVSKRQKEALGIQGLEAIRTTTARGLITVNITMAAMIAILQYGSVNTALGLQNGLGWSANLFAAILFVEAVGLAIKTARMSFTPKTPR